ncbi:MAG: hypothetical protein R2857_10875 [Vampirovibrionales bacterium]
MSFAGFPGLGGVPQYFMPSIRQALALDSTAVITATALAFDHVSLGEHAID